MIVPSPRLMAGMICTDDVLSDSMLSFYFWKFVHNAIIHPLLSLPYEPRCLQRAHDWTGERCKGAG